MYKDLVTKRLLQCFRRIDPNFKVIARSVHTNSIYYQVGQLNIRVSDHLKKAVEDLEEGCINLVKFPGSRSYLMGLSGSVFMKQTSIKNLEALIRSENFRIEFFFPKREQVILTPEEPVEIPPTVVNSGESSTWLKYHDLIDVRSVNNPALFGNLVKCIYAEFQVEYKKGVANKIYRKLTARTSYAELREIIKNELNLTN